MAFRVESRLGRGRVVDTFDAVLEVHGEKLDVVIKRARPEFSNNAALQDELLEWGLSQAEIDHPDVVAVLEAGRDQDGVYIIQERVDGATLARLLTTLRKGHRTLNPAHGLLIAERVASAVAGLQASGANYHGALKPTQVLVGYDGVVKLGDQRMGDLLSVVGRDLDAEDASPGQATGPSGDAYAFALMILEMMLGHPVWRTASMSVNDALRALVDFAPVAQVQPALARELRSVLQPCLESAPRARPAHFAPVSGQVTDLINRHSIKRDPEGLGAFVELISPPLEDADAPTRMAVAPEIDGPGLLMLTPDRKAQFEAASVVITPEILAQAEAEYHRRRAARPGSGHAAPGTDQIRSRRPVSRKASWPRPAPRAATLEGRSVPVELLRAPSSLRAAAAELPNVAAKAAASMAEQDWPKWWPYAAGVLSLLVVLVWLMSGSAVKTLQLRVTSEPSEASVFVNDDLVGQTPLTRPIDVDADQIELRFEKVGFEPYRVTIGTEEDELRYEAPLKPLSGAR